METLIQYIISPTFEGWISIIRIVFMIFSGVILISLILLLLTTSWLKRLILEDAAEFLTYRPFGVRKIEKQWNKIMTRLETGIESEFKLAVIEADSMLDDILRRMGFAGETLGERLEKLTAATLPNIEQIKEAHKIRNNIIHDPDYRLPLDEARRVMGIYEQAFRDLQAF